jgi:hypothetical protein
VRRAADSGAHGAADQRDSGAVPHTNLSDAVYAGLENVGNGDVGRSGADDLGRELTMAISPRGSSIGYSFTVWFTRNKDSLKTLTAGVISVATTWASMQALPTWALPLPALVFGFVSKWALDWIDYRYSVVTYKEE